MTRRKTHRGRAPVLEAYTPKITIIRQGEGRVTIFDGPRQVGTLTEDRLEPLVEAVSDWLNESTRTPAT